MHRKRNILFAILLLPFFPSFLFIYLFFLDIYIYFIFLYLFFYFAVLNKIIFSCSVDLLLGKKCRTSIYTSAAPQYQQIYFTHTIVELTVALVVSYSVYCGLYLVV